MPPEQVIPVQHLAHPAALPAQPVPAFLARHLDDVIRVDEARGDAGQPELGQQLARMAVPVAGHRLRAAQVNRGVRHVPCNRLAAPPGLPGVLPQLGGPAHGHGCPGTQQLGIYAQVRMARGLRGGHEVRPKLIGGRSCSALSPSRQRIARS